MILVISLGFVLLMQNSDAANTRRSHIVSPSFIKTPKGHKKINLSDIKQEQERRRVRHEFKKAQNKAQREYDETQEMVKEYQSMFRVIITNIYKFNYR